MRLSLPRNAVDSSDSNIACTTASEIKSRSNPGLEKLYKAQLDAVVTWAVSLAMPNEL